MTPEPARRYRLLMIAILVAGVVIGATILSYPSFQTTVTKTVSPASTTITVPPSTTITATSCTYTGFEVVACPSVYNETYRYSISYGGPWGASYQIYNGTSTLNAPVASGSFYGHGPENATIRFVLFTTGFEICTTAQKLDASTSTLVLAMFNGGGETNSTSLPFGQASVCLATEQI